MEEIVLYTNIQNKIENIWNQKKGILQLKSGQWLGDIYIWENGCWYYGETKNTYANGAGIFYDVDEYGCSCKYIGTFKNGKYHGYGKYRHFNGEYYMGEWKNNDRHGEGTIIYENGDMYSGNWFHNYKEGFGEWTYNKPKLGSKGFTANWHLDSIQYYIELK